MKKQAPIQSEINFQEQYKHLNDAEIKEILVMRKSYQDKAVSAAVQEAISRGIIQSEQDLFSEEYRLDNRTSSRLFPDIYKSTHKKKILASIHRVNYILGIIPLLFTGLSYSEGKMMPMLVFACAGLGWIFLNYKLSKTKNSSIIRIMFVVLTLAFVYVIYSLLHLKSPSIMDFIVVVLVFLIPLYTLLFAANLLKE